MWAPRQIEYCYLTVMLFYKYLTPLYSLMIIENGSNTALTYSREKYSFLVENISKLAFH